ncbi:MAG: pyrroline-5-carboxylate reductase [Gammaproteobacteria bacterium]|nr:pyrroline-5-carboxylate reductase [Gammaproteobacteria bacterium]
MKITFIGGGNMASSLIGGLVADEFNVADISVVDIDPEKRQHLSQQFGVQTFSELSAALEQVDVAAFCIKPQNFQEVAQAAAIDIKRQKPLVISIAAGIRTSDIATWLDDASAIVRAMSNTPALLRCGASGLYANARVTQAQRDQAESILRATGIVEWVQDESLMDVVTALSGSGPAYFFRIMESLTAAASQMGLPQEAAHLLTIQTALGAARMALESDDNIATLRQRVTSPGGTTEQGLKVMEENNIDQFMADILDAARKRSIELADQLGEV